MGKAIEEQSPWVSEDMNLLNDSIMDSGIGIDSYPLPRKPASATDGSKPWETGGFGHNSTWKQIFKLLVLIAMIIGIMLLIMYLLRDKAPSGESFRGMIKKSEISRLNSKDYELHDIDDEYYEITTTNKEVINNPLVQKDSFFELKAVAPDASENDCKGLKNWDKSVLGNDKFVEDYLSKIKDRPKVAIIDTGINEKNPQLKNNINKNDSVNIIKQGNPIEDKNGHGTNIAAIISRYVPNAEMIIIKASSGESKKVSYIDTIKAINYAIKKKPDVINISFGGGEIKKIDALQKAISKADSMGIIIVVSGGSVEDDMRNSFPSSYSGLITVGSLDSRIRVSNFSSISSDVLSPGECILSANDRFVNGNSYAAPVVTSLILLSKITVKNAGGAESYKKELKSSSDSKGGIQIPNIPKLLKISDDDNEYKKNIEGIKKDLDKADKFFDKFKDDAKKDKTAEGYEKLLSDLKPKLMKVQSDLKIKSSKINKIYAKNGIDLTKNSKINGEIEKDLSAISGFLNGDKLILEVTQEKRLKRTLGVDSCIINVSNLKCGKGKGAISESCSNRFEGGKNLICGMFVPIISSGAQLPATGNGKYVTILNNQEFLPIIILEGDDRISKNNKQIGKVVLEKLPKKVAGEAGGNVRFQVDLSGALSVKVTDINNKNNVVNSRIENLLGTETSIHPTGITQRNLKKIDEIQELLKQSITKL